MGTEAPTELRKWHAIVATIPLIEILPLGFGSSTNKANVAAFLGDKILNAKIARQLCKNGNLGLQELTDRQSFVHSNAFYADNLRCILPDHIDDKIEALADEQIHNAATMIEAAVAAVDSFTDQQSADEAITNLAEWLVNVAQQRITAVSSSLKDALIEHGDTVANFKGTLVNKGGSVVSERMPGYPDHAPRFAAIATLSDVSIRAEGSTKKESEQSAARSLLKSIGVGLSDVYVKTQRFTPALSEQNSTSEWKICEAFDDVVRDSAMTLKNNESPHEWWMRKTQSKESFHRMVMSPFVFPMVTKVNIWLSSPDPPRKHALVAVQLQNESGELYVESFTACGSSNTNAKHRVACLVNAYILQKMES